MKYTLQELKEDRYKMNYDRPLNFWLLTRISPYFTYLFINFTNFTPNQITIMFGITGYIAIAIISLGGYYAALIGILIYQIAIIFDMVDGVITRKTGKFNYGGIWIDTTFHYTHRSLILLALGVNLYFSTGNIFYFYLGLWTCFFVIFDHMNKLKVYEVLIFRQNKNYLEKEREKYAEEGEGKFITQGNIVQKIKAYIRALSRPTDPMTFIFWFILFNIFQVYLVYMAIIVFILWLRDLVSIYKRMRSYLRYKEK